MDIKNQVAVITGAGSGMGAETAHYLKKLGANVALLDYDQNKVASVAEQIGGFAVGCDVSQAASAEKAIDEVVRKFGSITICVNCAGIAPAARIVGRQGAMPLEDFERVVQVNLVGTFNIMRLCAAQMMRQPPLNKDSERGVIINTASVAAFEGQIGQAAYSASKGGVVALTLPAAREFSKFGIRVMAIAPGIVATPMMTAMPDEIQHSLAASVPFPKRLAHVGEYAHLVQNIIENSYLNGSVIRFDGALRMAAK